MVRGVLSVSAKKLSSVLGFGTRLGLFAGAHSEDWRRARHQGMAERRSLGSDMASALAVVGVEACVETWLLALLDELILLPRYIIYRG